MEPEGSLLCSQEAPVSNIGHGVLTMIFSSFESVPEDEVQYGIGRIFLQLDIRKFY
jgi:hypothetical protein